MTRRFDATARGADRREHSQSFRRLGDAARWLRDEQTKRDRGTWTDPSRGEQSLEAFWEHWRAQAQEARDPAPSTLSKYDGTWARYVGPSLGGFPLAMITRDDVERMLAAAARTSPWQADEARKLTRMLLGRALKAEAVGRNVAAGVDLARKPKRTRPRILTLGELDLIAAALPERFRAFTLLGAFGSLRWSELVAVRRDDLDLEGRRVRVDEKVVEVDGWWQWGSPKTAKSARWVDLPDAIMRPLAEHLLRYPPLRDTGTPEFDGLVFYGERRGPVRRHVFRAVWVKACAAAGVEGVRVEWLRHTGASLAYAATRDLKAVSERLGHTSTRMVDQVYVELYPEATRDVADALDQLVRASRNQSRAGYLRDLPEPSLAR
jgi:integrase